MSVGRAQTPLITPLWALSVDTTPRNIRGVYQIPFFSILTTGQTGGAAGSYVYALQTPRTGGAGRWIIPAIWVSLTMTAAPSSAFTYQFSLDKYTNFTTDTTGGNGTWIPWLQVGNPSSTLQISTLASSGSTAITKGTSTLVGTMNFIIGEAVTSLSAGDVIFNDYVFGPATGSMPPIVLGNAEGILITNSNGILNNASFVLSGGLVLIEASQW